MRASLRLALPAALLAVFPLALSAQATTTTTVVKKDSAGGQLTTTVTRTWTPTPTVAGLMTSIASADSAAVRWTAWKDASADNIELVDITPLVTAADSAAYARALAEHDARITALRTALVANEVLKTLLTTRQLTNATPVAVEFAPEGNKVRVYYKP